MSWHRCAALGVLALAIAAPATARAESHVIRIATIAPDGTEWARLARNFSREVAAATDNQVQIKWYFGGIAGGEVEMIARIRRGQLDGTASAGMMCQRLAPSMRLFRIVGLFQDRAEAINALGRLKPRIDAEMAQSGFASLGEAGFGSDVIFSREPVRTYEELKQTRFWIWDLDEIWQRQLAGMGFHLVPLDVGAADEAFRLKRIDGFLSIPSAALAFQWSTRARYFTDLPLGYLMGCLVVANPSIDVLSTAQRDAVLAASGKLMRHMEEMGRRQDDSLLHELFEKQGLKRVTPAPSLRSDMLSAARQTRARLGVTLVPPALLTEVNAWLADYRLEHHQEAEPSSEGQK